MISCVRYARFLSLSRVTGSWKWNSLSSENCRSHLGTVVPTATREESITRETTGAAPSPSLSNEASSDHSSQREEDASNKE